MDAFQPCKSYIVLDLLTWKSFFESLTVFASLNFFFLLLTMYDFSVISLLAYVLLGYLAVLYLLQVCGNPIHTDDNYEFVSRELIEKSLSAIHTNLNSLLKGISEMSLDEAFLQAILALFLAVFLAQIFSTAELIWLVVFLAFTVPLAFKSNKELMEGQIKTVKNLYATYKDTALRSIPRASSLRK